MTAEGIDTAEGHLAEYKATGSTDAVMAAFSASKNALAATQPSDPEYAYRLGITAESFFALFQLHGDFAALDGAMSVWQRLSKLPEANAYEIPANVTVTNEQWPNTPVTRGVDDHWWAINHPDGQVAYLGKNWEDWTGIGWPMGWTIQEPSGNRLSFDESHFGDGWSLAGDDEPSATAGSGAVTGTVGIGQDRYSFTATADGFTYEPIKNGKAGHVPAPVAVLRVMPMTDTEVFVMFAHGIDADNVFLTMNMWGDDPVQLASDVGSVLGSRVFLASD